MLIASFRTREVAEPALQDTEMNGARDRILYLKGDSAVEFGVVERAMGIARQAGVRVVAAVADRRVTPRM